MSDRRRVKRIYRARKAIKKAVPGQTIFKPVKIDDYDPPTQRMISGRIGATVSRNSKCICGSGKRFKRCHGKNKVAKNG